MRARELLDAGYPIAPECVAILELLGWPLSSCTGQFRFARGRSVVPASYWFGARFWIHPEWRRREYAKPHPEIFQRSSENLGLVPSMCAVIEDSEAGIQAARAAGSHAIGIGQHFASELTAAWRSLRSAGSLRDLAVILRVFMTVMAPLIVERSTWEAYATSRVEPAQWSAIIPRQVRARV